MSTESIRTQNILHLLVPPPQLRVLRGGLKHGSAYRVKESHSSRRWQDGRQVGVDPCTLACVEAAAAASSTASSRSLLIRRNQTESLS